MVRTNPFAVRVRLVVLGILLGVLLGSSASAQQDASSRAAPSRVPPADLQPEVETAGVVVDGVELFRVRGAAAFPARERAEGIRSRVLAVAADRSIDPSTIRVQASELGPTLTYGDGSVGIVTAVEADASREGLGQNELAAIYLRQVRAAVASHRALREPARLVRSAAWAAGATALLAVLWAAGLWVFRRFDRVIARRLEAGVDRLRIQSFRLLGAEQTLLLLRTLLRSLRFGAMLVLLYAYLNFTLSLFPWTRGFAAGMLGLVVDPLATIGRAALASLPDLAFLAVLTVVIRMILRLIRLFFDEIARGAVTFENFDADWAMPTYRLVRILVVAFALVVAFPYIPGSNTGAFKGMSLFVGVLFSLGSSSVIGNVIAGYTMTYRRAFRKGDRIRVGDVYGDVVQTRLLVTNVRTPKNEEIVVPNSTILSTPVVNYSAYARRSGLILHTTVGIGYEVPWRQVEAMLHEAARRTEGLAPQPEPFVLQTALGDFAVTYELNVPCDAPERMPALYTALHRNVLDVFNEYGVQIMTPAYESDPPEPKLVARDRWHLAPAPPGDAPDPRG